MLLALAGMGVVAGLLAGLLGVGGGLVLSAGAGMGDGRQRHACRMCSIWRWAPRWR